LKCVIISVFVVILLAISPNLFVSPASAFVVSNNSPLSSSSAQSKLAQPVYVWLFGYVGNTFYPQTQLNLTQSQVLQVAENLSKAVGKNNLNILTAVDEVQTSIDPNGVINSTMIPTIKNYVTELKQYAANVYGRLDFLQFNVSKPSYGAVDNNLSVYNQTNIYVNELGLSGVWFDRAPEYYENDSLGVGPTVFNQMMQNLTTMFPNSKFILNQAAVKFGEIQQLPGYTWENVTYICPTAFWPGKGSSSLEDNFPLLEQNYGFFPNHVLFHFDADGPYPLYNKVQPVTVMGVFANMSDSQEISTLNSLAVNGSEPDLYEGMHYSIVYPIIGSWTLIDIAGWPQYNETLYNSLDIGNYARDTYSTFVNIMLDHGDPAISLKKNDGPVGKPITVNGEYFSNGSSITIKFDNTTVATTRASVSNGYFSATFNTPSAVAGIHVITASDGIDSVPQNYTVTPKATETPSSGANGTTIKVKGTGFAASSNITITFDGQNVTTTPTVVTTSAAGSFKADYKVPSLSPGQYQVTVSDQNGDLVKIQFELT
jgi:hypothetical protein